MSDGRSITVSRTISEINRMTALLAVTVLIAAIASFFVAALTLHQTIWRDLTLAVIPNIITSCLIYAALYFSLGRVADLRQQAFRDDLMKGIKAAVSASRTVEVKVVDTIPGTPDDNIPDKRISADQSDILKRFLNTIYRLVAALTRNQDIRLYCHIADSREGLLHPVAVASARNYDDDYRVAIPFTGTRSAPFVIAKAMKEERTIPENLSPNHHDLYSSDLKSKIHPALKCVVAVPIFAYERPGDDETAIPIGTVAIDCTSATLEELGMVDSRGVVVPEIDDILKSCASVVHRVLTSVELAPKERRDAPRR
jgi:hypothetical protein